jgi:hypothetical protein
MSGVIYMRVIYSNEQPVELSSIYTSENFELIINQLSSMRLSTQKELLEFLTYFHTISPLNYSDLRIFLNKIIQNEYTDPSGRSYLQNRRFKKIIPLIDRILSMQFFRQKTNICLSELPKEVFLLIHQHNISDDINKLFKTAIKNDSYRSSVRDLFFGIFMGNIVDANGNQFSQENHPIIYERSWSVVYCMVREYSKSVYSARMKSISSSIHISLEEIQHKVILSISNTAQNNRTNLVQQVRAINHRDNGAYSYIRVSVDNEMTRAIDKAYKKQKIQDELIQETEPVTQPSHTHPKHILTMAYQKLGTLNYHVLLLPPLKKSSDKLRSEIWLENLEQYVFSYDYLSIHFTRSNQEETKKRIIALYISLNQPKLLVGEDILKNSQDQARRCRRNYIQKLLAQLFLELDTIYEMYNDELIRKHFQKIIPKVFEKELEKDKIKEATAIKNIISPSACGEDLLFSLLELMLERDISNRQFLLECQAIQTFTILVIVVNAIQQRTRAEKVNVLPQKIT